MDRRPGFHLGAVVEVKVRQFCISVWSSAGPRNAGKPGTKDNWEGAEELTLTISCTCTSVAGLVEDRFSKSTTPRFDGDHSQK